MPRVQDMSMEDLEQLIESKLLEILGDPDSGVELRPDFREKLHQRLQQSSRRTSHEEVLRRFAQS